MADFKLKPLDDRIVVQAERGRPDHRVGPGDPRHREGEAPGGHRRRGRPRAASTRTATSASPIDVKVGDTVIYSKYGGTEVKVEGEDYLILSARDVLAVARRTTEVTEPARGASGPVPSDIAEPTNL